MKPGSTSSLNPSAESYVPVSKRVGSNGKDDVSYAGAETKGPKDGPMAAFQPQGHTGHSGSLYVAEDSKLSVRSGNGIHGPSSYNAAEVTEKPTENVDSEMDIAYMQMTFPGTADEFLSEIYSVSQGDLESAIDMAKQLVMSAAAEPLVRKFVPVEISDIASAISSDAYRFSLASYNILAQAYVKSSYFPHSPGPCLRWKSRSKAVLAVLNNLGTDFLCLQEVDEYDTYYKQNMEKLGYSSTYIQRGGQKRDGCGIFYKTSSAELIFEDKIDYNELVKSIEDTPASSQEKDGCSAPNTVADTEIKSPKDSDVQKKRAGHGDPNDPRVRLKRDCVGIMAVFKLKGPSSHHVIVANTHLYWDPELADVKLAQAKYLLSRIAQFKQLVQSKLDCEPSIIVAGDFNSVPGDQVYRHLISGTSDLGSLLEDSDDESVPLSSVYAHTGGEPPFTNFTPGFTATLDYILFSPGTVQPVSFLELPEPESPDVVGGLPNNYHPSDHLPIGAEFEILK